MRQPRIAIVGAGSLAMALAGSLHGAGFVVDAILARPTPRSLARARRLAGKIGTRATSGLSGVNATVVWFCIPDSQLAAAAREAAGKFDWKGKVALHSSGALGSDVLGRLRARGAAVGSAHPLMTFVQGAEASLAGVPFALEGDRAAVRTARRIVQKLGGGVFLVSPSDKPAYHAWATFLSPLLTALLSTSERVAALAGVKSVSARQRMLPILRQTIENYAAFGGAKGFSGPLLRGDEETIRRHLQVLSSLPVARHVYRALAGAALSYLPARNRTRLKRLLESSGR
jgi:predicted short-subunit dehydrogenase-like oxidoreductase (DUF2520 family)